MSRNERQRDELLELCAAGAVARAVDLAFEHFAHFGRDEELLRVLDAALASARPSGAVRRRFDALRASAGRHAGRSGA